LHAQVQVRMDLSGPSGSTQTTAITPLPDVGVLRLGDRLSVPANGHQADNIMDGERARILSRSFRSMLHSDETNLGTKTCQRQRALRACAHEQALRLPGICGGLSSVSQAVLYPHDNRALS
jgi:hypothetical protein